MGNYNHPDVVYRGYSVTIGQFNAIMKQIPAYKKLMDDYGEHNYMMCYIQWKYSCLPQKLRNRAPKVIERWAPGVDEEEDPMHVLFPASYVPAERPELVKDPTILDETDRDLQVRDIILKFFRRRGVEELNTEDFQYTWCIGLNPALVAT